MVIQPVAATLDGVGATLQLSGEAVDENGFVLAGQPIRWRSLIPAVATVDSTRGRVTVVASGQAVIEATAGSGAIVGFALVTVSVPVSPSPAVLDSVAGPTSERLNAIWGSAPGDVWAVGMQGTILHFDGTRWERVADGLSTQHLWGVWGSSSSDVYIVGEAGTVLHFNGRDWDAPAPVLTTASLRDVWGASPWDIIIVGTGGTILRRTRAGWRGDTSGTTANLRGVWGASISDLWAVGDAGTILRYDGHGWQSEAAPTAAVLMDVWGTAPGHVVAVGGGGTIVRRSATGAWAAEPSGRDEPLNAVWGTSPAGVVAVGDGGTLVRFNGIEWLPVATSVLGAFTAAWGFSSGEMFLGGESGAMFTTGRGAAARLMFTAVPAQAVPAGDSFAIEVRIVDGVGGTVTTAADTITVALEGDTAGTLLHGHTARTAAGGTARFTLQVTRAARGYVLIASARGYARTRSPALTVRALQATRVVFVVEPSETRTDSIIRPAPQVAVVDLYGNPELTFARAVRVFLGANQSGGILRGGNLQSTSAGIATYADLSVSLPGNDYALVASSPGLASDTSIVFRVLDAQ